MATPYTTAVGRRKTASARIKMTPASKSSITVNGKSLEEYFKTLDRAQIANAVFALEDVKEKFEVVAKVSGGGVSAQAEAIRHAIARAVVKNEAGLRAPLKKAGFLKRDPRSVERKKAGHLKARKSPQWSKR